MLSQLSVSHAVVVLAAAAAVVVAVVVLVLEAVAALVRTRTTGLAAYDPEPCAPTTE